MSMQLVYVHLACQYFSGYTHMGSYGVAAIAYAQEECV